MKLSIVTSFYNCQNYINELAESIFSQDYHNWEWIICDDFSTDNTKQILEELSLKDARIRLVKVTQKKEMWWNPQIYATGDIVCPIDGDDKILPGTFKKIKFYFENFPEALLMHFNASKYQNDLPSSKSEYLKNFVDNVYISRDNDSFLEGFERLSPQRTGIFGYLRIFRNIPDLYFKTHDDSKYCSSNDGQWLLVLEEKGNWITIPRTTYLARRHYASENFRNWSLKGEVKLIKEAKERRKENPIQYPRKIKYFDDIYEAAESTYISMLNWEENSKKINFLNFNYTLEQQGKVKKLFFDHEVFFDSFEQSDYYFVRINCYDTSVIVKKYFEEYKIKNNITFYSDNTHLHYDNKFGINELDEIKKELEKISPIYFLCQENRMYYNLTNIKKIESVGNDFCNILLNGYENTQKIINPIKEKELKIEFNYFNNPRIDISCEEEKEYKIEFIDKDSNLIVYETILKNNMFAQLNREYHKDFFIKIIDKNTNELKKTITPDFLNKKIYIHLASSSLGDTLAWFPYVEKFRKIHNCKVVCSTFWNNIFKENYPEIEFVEPGSLVNNLYKMFNIGWFYDEHNNINYNKNPFNFRDQHLQKTASDILGLEFVEERPLVYFKISERRPISKKYFCIANHSTAQAKYWNNKKGWQEVVDFLKFKNYEVVLLSKEENGYMGNINPEGVIKIDNKSIQEIMNYVHYSEGFIGIGSGLSWLAWALNKKVFLISGFSRPNCEMIDCERIFVSDEKSICNGCFNDFKLDAGDWNWCPKHKGTNRQFECSKSITSEMVIEKIKKYI